MQKGSTRTGGSPLNDSPRREANQWEEWISLIESGQLHRRKPGELVAAFRGMPSVEFERERGKLLQDLQNRARAFLRSIVRKDLVDGGAEVIDEVIDKLNEALLTPGSKDGVGFEKAFYKKLRQRLTDRLRVTLTEKSWVEQLPISDDEAGIYLEPTDETSLSPEQIVMAADLLEQLDPLHRKAFALHLNGFKYTSSDPDESIAVMLGKSPQTIKTWVDRIRADIFELLGAR